MNEDINACFLVFWSIYRRKLFEHFVTAVFYLLLRGHNHLKGKKRENQ